MTELKMNKILINLFYGRLGLVDRIVAIPFRFLALPFLFSLHHQPPSLSAFFSLSLTMLALDSCLAYLDFSHTFFFSPSLLSLCSISFLASSLWCSPCHLTLSPVFPYFPCSSPSSPILPSVFPVLFLSPVPPPLLLFFLPFSLFSFLLPCSSPSSLFFPPFSLFFFLLPFPPHLPLFFHPYSPVLLPSPLFLPSSPVLPSFFSCSSRSLHVFHLFIVCSAPLHSRVIICSSSTVLPVFSSSLSLFTPYKVFLYGTQVLLACSVATKQCQPSAIFLGVSLL